MKLLWCLRAAFAVFVSIVLIGPPLTGRAEPARTISVDGDFSDWASVPSHFDPVGGPGVLHDGVPDTHDTNNSNSNDVPVYVNHPDIDLVEFKFAHDSSNLYAYFRATGQIGNTISTSTRHSRYYVIVTIDVDNSSTTGYGLHEGGYYPTSYGYDMNMEVEYYDGAFNTGHYLNHGARNATELAAAAQDQTNGIVRVLPGSYDYYTQWVWFDSPTAGTSRLPPPDDYASISFVSDRGPVYQGILRISLSPDGHQAEMMAPFRGFMRHPDGTPVVALGKILNISMSLEASGELAPGNSWASDTGDRISSYYLSPYPEPQLRIALLSESSQVLLTWAVDATGMALQQTASLSQPDWQVVPGSTATNQLVLPGGMAASFFRLVE